MSGEFFDMRLRALRRDRAFRLGPELFLYDRAFEDCLERLALVQRSFERALLIGCPDPRWPERLQKQVATVESFDPGPLFAAAANGQCIVEDSWLPPARAFDLCFAVGTLDTVNDVPLALRLIGHALQPDALILGAVAGGDSLPQLRRSMLAADQVGGAASAHVHPRIEPAALAPLLEAGGFTMPVVDVDRVQVSYRSLDGLVADLRRMGTTNLLRQRSRVPLGRVARAAAERAFAAAAVDGRVIETFEILHFAAWTPAGAAPV